MGPTTANAESRSNSTAGYRNVAIAMVALVAFVMIFSSLGSAFSQGVVAPETVALPSEHAGTSSSAATVSTLTPTALSGAPSMAQRAADMAAANKVGDSAPAHTYYPPNFMDNTVTPSANGNVLRATPEPDANPVGIGDFGVDNSTGTPVGTVLDTTSWEGTLTINNADPFLIDSDGPDWFGSQLNTQLTNVTISNQTDGVFWTQNVVGYEPSTGELYVENNIWNFSSTSIALPTGTLTGNGQIYGNEYYAYGFELSTAVTMPFAINLWTNASLTAYKVWTNSGLQTRYNSTVTFGYVIAGVSSGNYDVVQFNSTDNSTVAPAMPEFQINGFHLNPTGYIPYDAEMILGGPGGGSTISFYQLNGSISLQYWDSTDARWANAPEAWNIGFATGETAEGVGETWTQPGSVWLNTGPSIPTPFWNSTNHGGNRGQLTVTGTLDPANGFVFATQEGYATPDNSRWAPTDGPQAAGSGAFSYAVPPGTYEFEALMSNYNPDGQSVTGANETVALGAWALVANMAQGVYTPLYAWTNAELGAMSTGGFLWNNSGLTGGLSPLFGQMNDYLFPEFAGIMLYGTTTPTTIYAPVPPTVTFGGSPFWAEVLPEFGIDLTWNQLAIQFFYTTDVNLVHATLSSWEFADDFGFPEASVVFWDASASVVAYNTFADISTGMWIMNDLVGASGGNWIWGNAFNTAQAQPASSATLSLAEFESGDWIVNNWFGSVPEVYSPSENVDYGISQINNNAYNFTGAVPAPSTTVYTHNGIHLTGSILGAAEDCGNVWADEVAGANYSIPYNAEGNIATGGDYCAQASTGFVYSVKVLETGLANGTPWSVTVDGLTGNGVGLYHNVSFGGFPVGKWIDWSTVAPAGYVAVPEGGQVNVTGPTTITLNFQPLAIAISTPVAGQNVGGSVFNLSVSWTNTGTTTGVLEEIGILDAAGVYAWNYSSVSNSVPNNLLTPGATNTFVLNSNDINGGASGDFSGNLPDDCYQVVVDAFNATFTNPGYAGDAPLAPLTASVAASQPFCVGQATLVSPVSGAGDIPEGAVNVSWSYDVPSGTGATLWVTSSSSSFSTPVQTALGYGQGTQELLLSPGTYTAWVSVVNPYGLYVNSTASTFTVVSVPSVGPCSSGCVTWYNTTSTTWNNETASTSGIAANVLGAVLIEVGLIVGIILGIVVGAMFRRKPDEPSSDSMGGVGGAGGMGGSTGNPPSSPGM